MNAMADLLIQAKQSGDYSAAAFAPLEEMTLNYVNMHDRLVVNSYQSWQYFKLWNMYEVLWLLGAYLEYLRLITNRYRANGHRAKYIELMRPIACPAAASRFSSTFRRRLTP